MKLNHVVLILYIILSLSTICEQVTVRRSLGERFKNEYLAYTSSSWKEQEM